MSDVEEAELDGVSVDVEPSGAAFIGFENLVVGEDEYELNTVAGIDDEVFAIFVVGVEESDECDIGGEGVDEGFLTPLMFIGPEKIEWSDFDFESDDEGFRQLEERYGDETVVCQYYIALTEAAYVLTLGDGLTSFTANGQDFKVSLLGDYYDYYYYGYDYYGYDYYGYDYYGYGYYYYGYDDDYQFYYYEEESSAPPLETWADREAMEASATYQYLINTAEYEPREIIQDMDGEVWDWRSIEAYPNDLIYLQMTGVDEDGECEMIDLWNYEGQLDMVRLFGNIGPAEQDGEFYCAILLFIDPEYAEDGQVFYGTLTDNYSAWLDAEFSIGFAVIETESDSIADADTFQEAYNAALGIFHRLQHHQMIMMEDWFDMNLASTTIWVEAGEEFGIIFFTNSYGAFTATLVTSDDEDTPLLVSTADYYVPDDENGEFFQFNAWSVDRYTEMYEASVTYTFEYDDEDESDYEFTVYIERQESESEAWEITAVEDLLETYEDLCSTCGFVKEVEFLMDGDETYAWAREGDEIGFIFFSERSDLDIAFEFDEDNTLLYATGTFADAIRYQVPG